MQKGKGYCIRTGHAGSSASERPLSEPTISAFGRRSFSLAWIVAASPLAVAPNVDSAAVVRQGSGATPAALQPILDQFRTDLGGTNNGVGGTFFDGRREINWDGVPDSMSAPNFLTPDFFNVNSPRGVVFHTVLEDAGSAFNDFMVSATVVSGTPVRFGDINPTYTSTFITNSAQRLFMPRGAHAMLVKFYRPGTTTEATVNGFGAVFSDVDSGAGGGRSVISAYAPDGTQLVAASAPVLDGGLSFVGVSFNAGERIGHVIIRSGTHALSASNNDGVGGVDVVAMDDFIYRRAAAGERLHFHRRLRMRSALSVSVTRARSARARVTTQSTRPDNAATGRR